MGMQGQELDILSVLPNVLKHNFLIVFQTHVQIGVKLGIGPVRVQMKVKSFDLG